MGSSGETLDSKVVQRFLDLRRKGRRVSIDAVLDSFPDLGDRKKTRTQALRTITAAAQETRGLSRAPGQAPQPADELAELPQLEDYDIIDLVGQGGMGRVYEAYQQSTGRRVGVKFLLEYTSASDDARHRFEREVELAARLQHPNIVSVLDSGILKGRYYYVMEFVDGKPLDAVLTPGKCDVRQAMHLLQQICETVDYAHQRGVLHRDLKPSNILVDGRDDPHILDFGLAKALNAGGTVEMTLSAPGQLLGTLAYMSPEQAQGDMQHMSVRSDVYSLGAIIYEILTGSTPYDITGPLSMTLHNIAEQTPRDPSTVRPRLDRDAGAIALKALEKAPNHRYATAGELAADIQRFLANQTILARRPSLSARMVRWVRRNRAVATVGGIALTLIVGITIASFISIMGERDLAQESRDRAQESLAMVARNYLSTNPDATEAVDKAMSPVLDSFAHQLETTLTNRPDDQAELRNTIGAMYIRRAEYKKAQQQFEMALAQRIELHGPEHPAVAECYHNLGRAFYFQRLYRQSEENYGRALSMRVNLVGETHDSTMETKYHLATVYARLGDREHAEELYREVLAFRTGRFGGDSADVAHAHNNLGWFLLDDASRLSEAEEHLRATLDILQKLPEDQREPERQAVTMHNLGDCLFRQERYEEAETWLSRSLSEKERLRGRDSVTAAETLYKLADLKFVQGEIAEAQPDVTAALKVMEAELDPADTRLRKARELLTKIQEAGRGQDAGTGP